MRRRHHVLTLSLAALLAACGGTGGASTGPTTAPAGSGAAATAGTTPAAPAGTPAAASPAGTVAASGGEASAPAAGGDNEVAIQAFEFRPAEITVGVGDTVTWTHADTAPHTVKFDDEESPHMEQGAEYERTFDTAGTFAYICGIHPRMEGSVVVE